MVGSVSTAPTLLREMNGLRPMLSCGTSEHMKGTRHRKYGGGLGGTTADSVLIAQFSPMVLSAYASAEQARREQELFRRSVKAQRMQDNKTTVLLRLKRKAAKLGDSTRG